MIAQHLQMDVQ